MMDITLLLFYVFSATLLSSAILVVTARNMVHGILFLILAFFNAAGLFILVGAEFLAMMLVIVYVGAVAVLFLFVVMMLNVGLKSLQQYARSYSLIGSVVGGVFAAELILILTTWRRSSEALNLIFAPRNEIENTPALGNLIYTHYAIIFQAVGLILLIAMVGAIVLTLRQREGVQKQKINEQLKRDPQESIKLLDIPRGESAW